MDKAARKLSSPKKSCFGEYFVRSLQTFWPKEALPRYTEAFFFCNMQKTESVKVIALPVY